MLTRARTKAIERAVPFLSPATPEYKGPRLAGCSDLLRLGVSALHSFVVSKAVCVSTIAFSFG